MQEQPPNYQTGYNPYGQPAAPTPPPGNTYYQPGYQPAQPYYYPEPARQSSFRLWIFLLIGGIALLAVAAFLLVALAFGNVATQISSGVQIQSWQTLNSKEGRFKIDFPGKPANQSQPVTLPNLTSTTLYMWTLETPTNNYMTGYNDYPDALVRINSETLLKGARDGAISMTGGKFKSEKKISYGVFPGREVTYMVGGDKTIIQRIYIVNNRLYQMAVGFITGKEAPNDTAKFFNSFVVG